MGKTATEGERDFKNLKSFKAPLAPVLNPISPQCVMFKLKKSFHFFKKISFIQYFDSSMMGHLHFTHSKNKSHSI